MTALSRFEQTFYRTAEAGNAQVPYAEGPIVLHGRGATVAVGVTIGGSASHTVEVEGLGDIVKYSALTAGVNGPSLTVTAAPPYTGGPATITVSNGSSDAVVLTAGTRLILTSDPPAVYADPLGTVPLSMPLFTDASGRLAVYVGRRWFDCVKGAAVAYDTKTEQFGVVDDEHSLTWPHTVDATGRGPFHALLVGISWAGVPTIGAVTYGEDALELVATTSNSALYALASPPVGTSHDILITFEEGSGKAVATGISFKHVNDFVAIGSSVTNTGTGNHATLASGIATHPGSMVLDLLSITGSNEPSADSPQVARWNASYSTSPTIRGGASTLPSVGGNRSVGWNWATNTAWKYLAAAISPILAEVFVDVQGTTQAAPDWVNARDFPTLQDALAALPNTEDDDPPGRTGGVLYLPAGTYEIAATLEVNTKCVTICGDGAGVTIIKPAAALNFDLIKVKQPFFNMYDLTLDGNTAGATPHSCLVVGRSDNNVTMQSFLLRDMTVHRASSDGIHLRGVILATLMNVASNSNGHSGILIENGEQGTTTVQLLGCTFAENEGSGVEVGASCTDIAIMDCNCAANSTTSPSKGNGLTATQPQDLRVVNCTFSSPPPEAPQLVFVSNGDGVQVLGCMFDGTSESEDDWPNIGVNFVNCSGVSAENNCGTRLLEYLLQVDSDTAFVVTTGNREIIAGDDTPARILEETGSEVFSLNDEVVGCYRYPSDDLPIETNKRGALVWSTGVGSPAPTDRLQLCDGGKWMAATATVGQFDSGTVSSVVSGDLIEAAPGAGLYRLSYFAKSSGAAILLVFGGKTITLAANAEISGTFAKVLSTSDSVSYTTTFTSSGSYLIRLRAEIV